MGPFSNAPIDTIKTRKPAVLYSWVIALTICRLGLQKSPGEPGKSAIQRITWIAMEMWKTEGMRSFYKGITPRVLRVAPGQAIVFAVYERVSRIIETLAVTQTDDHYSE